MKRVIKDYRLYIYIALVALSVTLGATVYRTSYIRLWEALKRSVGAFGIYFNEIFETSFKVNTDIKEFTKIDVDKLLPFTLEEMLSKLKKVFPSLFKWEYISSYLLFFVNALMTLSLFLPVLALVFVLFGVALKSAYLRDTDKEGKSKALKVYLRTVRPFFCRISAFLKSIYIFGLESSFFVVLGIIWALNLNMLGILVAFIGVYVYFVATFDITGLFKNLVNLIVDLTVMFSGLPLLVWIVIASILLNIIRKHIGMKRLKNNELKNRAFIKDKLSLVNLICGFMRSGKNLTETDIALSAEMIHKDMALEGMVNEWYKLPDFPFHNLEKEIERAVMFGEIKDLPTARVFASKKRERFLKNICPEKLFGYDTSRYSTEFDNGMYVETVFDIIETYTQLYLMYCVDTSLIVSNYSVRSGAIKDDNGHFPLWNEDFFDAPSLIEEMYDGNYSHIIDYDMFRLGRRVNENSEVGLFGYGIALMSEKGKERGNAVENQCYKKDDYRANPKNDYFNLFLKVIAHGATVDYQTFALVLGDEQRPESVGADEREISTLVHILNRDKDMLAMPFFELEELAYMFFRNHFDNFIKQYRYHRSDETLFMYLLKSCIHRFYSFYKRTYGIYGYDVVKLGLEKGIMDGNIEEHKYYIANHKTKARRYSTDCYRNMLAEKAKVGLNDLPTYRGVQGDGDEMYEQNSFFVNEFKKHLQD